MKINYLNFNTLWNPQFKNLLSAYPQHDWVQIEKLFKLNYGMHAWYNRTGKNTLPFRNDIVHHPCIDMSMPDYDSQFKKSWAEITDQRCQQLISKHNDKPWLVLWSGGIDSTMMLTSILKNFNKEELKQVHVALNRVSVYENPRFYYNHIVPNFHQLDSTTLMVDADLLNQYYVITGEPADQLYTAGLTVQRMMLNNFSDLDRNVFTDPDRLLNQLAKDLDQGFATWFYEMVIENIQSTNIPIETYADFNWWFGFNLNWIPAKIRNLRFLPSKTVQEHELFLKNFVLWFDTYDYQLWAMQLENRRNGVKSGKHIGQYKLPLKQYIFEFDRDDYYFNFKFKNSSNGRHLSKNHWACMLEDLSVLTIENNSDLIAELLPAHINLD